MAKNISKLLVRARSAALAEISANARSGPIAAGMANEGYAGGYVDACNDVVLALNGVIPNNSRFWPQSLILVVEDDAQDGVDHVDGHRTIALAISPHIRRNVLDSNHYNQTNMVRTIQEIFAITPKTRYLKSARAMTSMFTPEADLTPYKCLKPEVALDELNPPLDKTQGRRRWAAEQSLAINWSEVDDVPKDTLNRILWWDSKGFDQPFPNLSGR